MEQKPRHSKTQEDFDNAQSEGLYEEGMANMALYHRHCQDPVIFSVLEDVRGKALLDLACGEGFYTRRFRKECGADPVVGIDLSPKQIEKARAIEASDPLGIEYFAGDASDLDLDRRFDVVTAIHLLHYLESRDEIAGVLGRIHRLLRESGRFVTMIANPEFDLGKHDPEDSKSKFAYYFSAADPENGGTMRFHPGGLEKEREITVEFRRWHRDFLNEIAREAGFEPEWHDPFISAEGLSEYGEEFFENYLPNPQSKLLVLTKRG
ncbi:MAG TPA: class I SAM-dependent methyltransferase [Aridibacter sp.]|nr:class I SAM-dependent methyltransferase [Aridibacter sp.]